MWNIAQQSLLLNSVYEDTNDTLQGEPVNVKLSGRVDNIKDELNLKTHSPASSSILKKDILVKWWN